MRSTRDQQRERQVAGATMPEEGPYPAAPGWPAPLRPLERWGGQTQLLPLGCRTARPTPQRAASARTRAGAAAGCVARPPLAAAGCLRLEEQPPGLLGLARACMRLHACALLCCGRLRWRRRWACHVWGMHCAVWDALRAVGRAGESGQPPTRTRGMGRPASAARGRAAKAVEKVSKPSSCPLPWL